MSKIIFYLRTELKGPQYDKNADPVKQSPTSLILSSYKLIISADQRTYSPLRPLINYDAEFSFLVISFEVLSKSSSSSFLIFMLAFNSAKFLFKAAKLASVSANSCSPFNFYASIYSAFFFFGSTSM